MSKPFAVLFDLAAATNVSALRVYIDSQKVGADLPVKTGTTQIDNLTLTAKGAHGIKVSSVNPDGVEVFTDVLMVTAVSGPPTKPTNLRILVAITVAENGSLSVKVVGVENGPQ